MAARNMILYRWVIVGVLLAGTAGWLLYAEEKEATMIDRSRPKSKETHEVRLPSDAEKEKLQEAIKAVRILDSRDSKGLEYSPSPHMMEMREKASNRRTKPVISLILRGGKANYAIISGVMYMEGDTLPDGRTVADIQADKVVLQFSNYVEEVPWKPPMRVEIIKNQPALAAEAQERAEAEANATDGVSPTELPRNISQE